MTKQPTTGSQPEPSVSLEALRTQLGEAGLRELMLASRVAALEGALAQRDELVAALEARIAAQASAEGA